MANEKSRPFRSDQLDRRQFIKAGSMFGLGSLFLPDLLLPAQVQGGECLATSDDILGPYYLAGSPETTQIASEAEPGTRLHISGSVLSNDCMTPVAGAMIEIWQANAAAEYDTSSAFNLRGTLYSDANGQYSFATIMPGAYLNGSQYRPRHIHYRITREGFPTLITQLYFEGDPYIPADPWASQPDAAMRIIPLNEVAPDELEGVFDIVLDGHVGIKPNRYGEQGDLLPPYPNPSMELTSIHFNVFRKGRIQIMITDLKGNEVITLLDEDKPQGRYTTQWNGRDDRHARVTAGTYMVHLLLDGAPVRCQRLGRL